MRREGRARGRRNIVKRRQREFASENLRGDGQGTRPRACQASRHEVVEKFKLRNEKAILKLHFTY